MNEPRRRPNIVVVVADDMGYGDPGCYNPASTIPTPAIDRLAREGTRFTDAHSPSALCTPSRYGLLTGRYHWRTSRPHHLVMPYDPPILEPDRVTIASMLRERGYRTACIGKWHLGFLYPTRDGAETPHTRREADIDFSKPLDGGPLAAGFDAFFGTAGCSTSDPPYGFIEDDRTVGIPAVPSPDELNRLPGFYPGLMAPGWRIDDVDLELARRAAAYIADHAGGGSADPFFLYVALSAPHNPWIVPPFLEGASGDGPRGDMNALADRCLGRVVDELERQGILDDTLLVYTSDHGPQYEVGATGHRATGPYRGRKNTAFEGGHRVPFVARWGDAIPAGATSDLPICHTDLLATFAELTGDPLPEHAGEDGFSLLPNLLDPSRPPPPRPALVADTGHHGLDAGDFAIRRDGWKLIVMAPRGEGDPGERLLFDLERDPFERDDLRDAFPEVVAELEELLERLRERGAKHLDVGR